MFGMIFDLINKHVGFADRSEETGWRPSYLRRRILVLFVIAFCAIIAALEALFQSSAAHDGIAASTESRHYLWTYGPTAILTIVATFWSRVEFQSKQIAPWQSMLQAPQPADKSVLLDYISDMQPVAMWKSFKNKQLVVFSGVTCSMLVQLMIVFSTSLFSLQEVHVLQKNVTIQLHDMFTTQNSTLEAVGSQPYDIINGIVFDNLTYPGGTNANLAFQEFSAPNVSSSAIVTAPIDGLKADLSCEYATVDTKALYYKEWLKTNGSQVELVTDFQIVTPSCNISNYDQLGLGAEEYTQIAHFEWAQCGSTNTSDDIRILVLFIEVGDTNTTRTKASAYRGPAKYETVQLNLERHKIMICKPTLLHVKLQAQRNATDFSSDIRLQTLASEETTLPGLTAGDIAEFIKANSSDTTGFRGIERFNPFPADAHVDEPLRLGLLLAEEEATLENLWREDVLRDSASAYYRAMTAQLMHMGLVKEHESKTVGSALVNENRVVMMQLPLRGIEACLAVVILLSTLMILFAARQTVATWNPANISAIAAVTANSVDFRHSLRGLGAVSDDVLRGHLVGQHYYSKSTSNGTSIGVTEHVHNEPKLDQNLDSKYHTWRPFPSILCRIAILFLVASAIAILEILLHLSEVNKGLGTIGLNDEYMHYVWTIIPAAIMTGFSLAFGSIDFNTRCLAPYSHLKRPTGALFSQSMNVSFLDALGFTNGFRAFRSMHLAILTTTLSTGAAFFITIVVSGLYSVIEVPSHAQANFTRVGGFPDPRTIAGVQLNLDEASEVAGIITAEYILQYNFSYPRWTYEDLAFAEISMDDPSNQTIGNGSFVDIRVPALRSAPVCKLYTAVDLKPTISQYFDGITEIYQLTSELTTLACPGNNTDYHWNATVFSVENLQDGPFGYSIESYCHADNSLSSHYIETYVWGHVNRTSVGYIMAMTCMQYAETIDVETRLKLPELEIDEEHPPVPDESSAIMRPNLYTPIPEWWTLNTDGQYPTLDGFFYLLVTGKYAIASENLETPDQNQTVIDAIKRQHKIINAQQLSNYTRGTANDSIPHALLLGNVTNSSRLRLIQDPTSTRILEALLGAMLILGIISSVLLDTDHVLPKNPCSIAAVASLLADSDLLDQFVQGAWDPNHKSLDQTFAYRRFYLGWWENGHSDGPESGKVFTIAHTSAEKEA
ncbi:uncharacterized protein N7482_002752 [Penicillium canariense]|uniref:Uncharacterized protein n=1 Tax=Penicillium canariense TaxID=189055 RepID=A0A9W9IJE5_9EURO|nr:uncharacterized protein N7482_002752 [Penicillium canariense]KAJ5176875.1 hypothetical protein N7482_002752 [Penicillium canariense]